MAEERAKKRREPVRPASDSDRRSGPPAPAAAAGTTGTATPNETEPWKQAALSILIAYLSFHLAALALLTIYPLFFGLNAEDFMGRVYLDLLNMEIQKVGLWIIAPLSGAVSVASLWRAEMDSKRRWLLRLSIAGTIFAALFYVILVWMMLGINLWQYEGPPDHAEFRALAGAFSLGNFFVFAAALFGALGAQIPGWFGGRSS
jgi:hypothetical protein